MIYDSGSVPEKSIFSPRGTSPEPTSLHPHTSQGFDPYSSNQRHLSLFSWCKQRFRGGLVFKAHRLCVSLNSRLESNKEEEKRLDSRFRCSCLSSSSADLPLFPTGAAFPLCWYKPCEGYHSFSRVLVQNSSSLLWGGGGFL